MGQGVGLGVWVVGVGVGAGGWVGDVVWWGLGAVGGLKFLESALFSG